MRGIMARCMCTNAGRALVRILVLALFGHDPDAVSLLAFCRYVRANDSIERMGEIGPGSLQVCCDPRECRLRPSVYTSAARPQAWTCLGGAQQISLRLAQQVRAGGTQILFGQRVTDVQRQAGGGLRIVCQSGAIFQGAAVVIAIPPPLVGRIAFSPPLPPARAALLRDATMGCIIKTSILYRAAFWRSAGYSGEAISDALEGPAFNVFDGCAPVLASALDPSNPQGIVFADATLSDPAVRLGSEYVYVPCLVVFINGDRAREWSAVDPPARRAAVLAQVMMEAMLARRSWPYLGSVFPSSCFTQLERWFGPEAGAPLEYIEKDWAADEHTGGW